MRKPKGIQENRKYTDYGGNPACQGCEIFNLFVCPLAERAYERGEKLTKCDVLRPFGEKIIESLKSHDKRRKQDD